MALETLPLFPETALVDERGHLVLGGVDTLDLAAEYGTPLYVFDEATLRGQCRAFSTEFSARYPRVKVLYAGKAFLNRPLASLLAEEGLGLDRAARRQVQEGLQRRSGQEPCAVPLWRSWLLPSSRPRPLRLRS